MIQTLHFRLTLTNTQLDVIGLLALIQRLEKKNTVQDLKYITTVDLHVKVANALTIGILDLN